MGDLFDEVAFFYFKNLGYTTFEQVEKLTLPEINLQMRAYNEKAVEEEGKVYSLAYLTNAAGSITKRGTAKYPTFKSFYNYEEALKRARGEEDKPSSMFERVVKYRKEKGVA